MYVFAGNQRVAKVTDTTLEYYHKDHLGSTNAISREDGTIIDSGEYMPYGLDRSTNALLQTSAYKFTDQEQDDGTGLYNYDARLYDPVIGQFIMADTIVPDLFNPQSLNRYAYCLNNPVKYKDPNGHVPILLPGAIGAFFGGGANAIKNWEDLSRGKLSRIDYFKSIGVGAAAGFISAYRGPGGAGIAAALNEIHEQTIRGGDITNYDTSQIITAGAVGYFMGHVGQTFQDLGEGIGWFGGDYIGQTASNFGTVGSVLGEISSVFVDSVYSPSINESFDEIDTNVFDELYNDFLQEFGLGDNNNNFDSGIDWGGIDDSGGYVGW